MYLHLKMKGVNNTEDTTSDNLGGSVSGEMEGRKAADERQIRK